MTYNQDKINATILLSDLYNKYPEIYKADYKIITYGKIDVKNVEIVKGKENFGLSPFAFPFDEYRSDYIVNFLKIMGLPNHIDTVKNNNTLEYIAKQMPHYPENGYIRLYDGIIIINLQ